MSKVCFFYAVGFAPDVGFLIASLISFFTVLRLSGEAVLLCD